MADVHTGTKPKPATLLTGFESPLGRSAALALARAGHRLCVVRSDGTEGEIVLGELPGHERLQHQGLSWNLADTPSLPRLAAEARSRLGHVTGLLHVAPAPRLPAPEELDSQQLLRQLQLGAAAFLSLGLALLPEMFATQTGTLCVLTPSPASTGSYAAAEVGAAAQLGALLGAVSQLAERCAGTPLRSLLLHTGELGAAALGAGALTTLVAQLSDSEELPPAKRTPETALLENGWRGSLALPGLRSRIELLASPPAPVPSALPVASAVAAPTVSGSGAAAAGPDRIGERLAQTFRSTFGLAASVELSSCVVGSVPRWDSLGHLKLMMEVERALRVRLPAEQLAKIQSYRDLEQAVRAHLSA
jgi:NAD(P)-dependent dehydrogenase (short-subunit alcohol dehydrogenase family)/acyl carrier protein